MARQKRWYVSECTIEISIYEGLDEFGKDQETFLDLCICIALKDIHRILKKTVLLC